MVKNYLSVFVNCMIENPAFDSQAGALARCAVLRSHDIQLLRSKQMLNAA